MNEVSLVRLNWKAHETINNTQIAVMANNQSTGNIRFNISTSNTTQKTASLQVLEKTKVFHVLYYAPTTKIVSVKEYVLGNPAKPKRYNSTKGTIHIHYRTKGFIDKDRNLEDYDAIFFTFASGPIDLPPKRKGQLFVAWICENGCLYPHLSEESVRAKHPTIDYTISTSKKSNWWFSWTGAWPLAGIPHPQSPQSLQTTSPMPFQSKKPAVLALYGNCNTNTKREVYLRELSRYFTVESRGGCSVSVNNHKRFDSFSFQDFAKTVPRKLNHSRQYLFTAAMENAICTDYVSEKVFQALAVGSVPIFLGAPNAAQDYLPTNSTIFASDYTPQQLAQYLQRLSQNQEEYEAYLQWKQTPMEPHLTQVWDHSIDHILDALLGFLLQGAPS